MSRSATGAVVILPRSIAIPPNTEHHWLPPIFTFSLPGTRQAALSFASGLSHFAAK